MLYFFFFFTSVAVSKAEPQDNIVQESLTSENWMWPRYFYKGCRIAKKKEEEEVRIKYSHGQLGSFFLLKCLFDLEKMEEKGWHTGCRGRITNHSGYLSPEGRCSPSMYLKEHLLTRTKKEIITTGLQYCPVDKTPENVCPHSSSSLFQLSFGC